MKTFEQTFNSWSLEQKVEWILGPKIFNLTNYTRSIIVDLKEENQKLKQKSADDYIEYQNKTQAQTKRIADLENIVKVDDAIRITKLEATIKGKDNAIECYINERENLEKKIKELEAEVIGYKASLERANFKALEKDARINENNDRIKELEHIQNFLFRKAKEYRNRSKELEAEAKKWKQDNRYLSAFIHLLYKGKDANSTAIIDAANKMDNLEAENARLKAVISKTENVDERREYAYEMDIVIRWLDKNEDFVTEPNGKMQLLKSKAMHQKIKWLDEHPRTQTTEESEAKENG